MTNSPARLSAVCLIAALGLAHASSSALANTRDHSYVYLANGGSITMSGDARDVARARSFKQASGPLLLFREAGQEYLVRDPDTLAQLDAVWKPGRELDIAESKLDRQHDGLDRKHDQLDTRRDALEARRDRLSDRDSELADRESEDSLSASARGEIAKKRRELQQQRQALDAEIHALEQPMNELRTQMDAIQRQLDGLHEKQKAISSKEETEMWALLRRAIAAGTAKPVK
jgi:bla regulator protein blaR1